MTSGSKVICKIVRGERGPGNKARHHHSELDSYLWGRCCAMNVRVFVYSVQVSSLRNYFTCISWRSFSGMDLSISGGG